MADKRVSDSSHKRRSQEGFSSTTPAKKPAIGFSLKSNSLKKSSSTTTKSLKPVTTTNKHTQNSIALKLGKDKPKTEPTVLKKSSKLAAVFNEDSDSEPEEIPPEAKMRMKNIGRNTPTSSGPNSFNKGKLGFCDSQRLWEKRQEEIAKKNEQSVKK